VPLPLKAAVIDVGLRDGLQNEATDVPTDGKLRLARALVEAGVREMEVTSFVRPDLVPRLSDAEAVVAGLPARDGVTYVALVANEQGYDRAAAAGIKAVIFVLAATDAFNERNVRRPVARSVEDLRVLCRRGAVDGVALRAAIAVSFGCPFAGRSRPKRCSTSRGGARMRERPISTSPTRSGSRTRGRSPSALPCLRAALPAVRLAAHFHDTRGMGLANVWAALGAGIDRFDASIAGLGGCPFAPGATGNIATEDTVHLLHAAGVDTGIDIERLFAAADIAEELVGRPSAGRVKKAERAAAGRRTA